MVSAGNVVQRASLTAMLLLLGVHSGGMAFNAMAQEAAAPPKQSALNTWFHCYYSPEARDQLKTKLDENREKLGADHPDTLASLEAYTSACAKLSDVKDFLPNRELVFEKRKTLLGEDHPLTLLSMVLLADAYTTEGQFPRGLTLAQDALERFKRVVGPDHIDTLAVSRVLGDYLGVSGDLAKARELVKATLDRQIATLGESHPETLRTKLGFARCMAAEYEYKLALDLTLAVHEEHLKSLGPKHPETIDSMLQLALAYTQQGDFASATTIAGEAHQYATQAFPVESDAMSALSDIATVLREAGFILNAHDLLEKELQLRTKHLGADHPKTLLLRLERAKVLFSMGEREELQKQLEADLQKLRPMFAPNDLRIINSEITLANLGFRMGDDKAQESLKKLLERSPISSESGKAIQKAKEEAFFAKLKAQESDKKEDILPILQASFEVYKSKLGEDHPDTLGAQLDIVRYTDNQGDHAKAITLYEDLIRKMQEKLGKFHPLTIGALEYLANAFEASGQHDKAIRLLTQIGQARSQSMGPNCPRTMRTYIEIARRYRNFRRFDVAANILEQVQSRQKDRWPIDNKERTDTAILLAGCYLQLGKGEDAIKIYKPVYEHLLSAKGPKDDQTLMFHGGLVEAYFSAGKKEEAVKELETLVSYSREVNAAEPLKVAETLKRAAIELNKYGSPENAEKYLRESLTLLEIKEAPKWDKVAITVHLARSLAAQSKFDEAEKQLIEAYDLASKSRADLPPQHKFLIALCADSLQNLYAKKGDMDSSAKWKTTFTEEIELSKPK